MRGVNEGDGDLGLGGGDEGDAQTLKNKEDRLAVNVEDMVMSDMGRTHHLAGTNDTEPLDLGSVAGACRAEGASASGQLLGEGSGEHFEGSLR